MIPLLAIFCLISGQAAGQLTGQGWEEFNGPFPSWADVKKAFGATGNGKDDDTKAFQAALDSLHNPNSLKRGYTVIYVPAGTYCISSKLLLKGKIGVALIGEDPEHTILKWTGKDKDTMLWANGSAYFKISRLTWDAGGKKDMEGIGIHWKDQWNDGKTRSYASLNIELSDNFFIGGFKEGISGGTRGGGNGTGANDSEITIRRCVFRDCSVSGIEIEGFNALDYWIWDCRFVHCRVGVNCSYGGYHLYRSFFSGSTLCDVHNNNGYYTSVRGCYSENSNAFSLDASKSTNPFKRVFQDNTIVNPQKLPVEYYHVGRITLWGNTIKRTLDSTYAFSVQTSCWNPYIAEVMSLHNSYGYKDPIRINSSPQKIYSVGDVYDPSQTSSSFLTTAAFLNTLDPTPRKVDRRVLEVPAGANADTIQFLFDLAARLKGQRPVVHFAQGAYKIDKTLKIPAGSDMQLSGDGLLYASMILRSNPQTLKSLPLLKINGPAFITIRDLQIGSEADKDQAAGIEFEGLDQPRSEVHLDQIYSHADTSLMVEGMNYLYIQKNNSFFTYGNYIVGGRLAKRNKGTASVCCFGGQFSRLTVLRDARFLAKDCWWEGAERIPLDLAGSGTICIDGAMVAPMHADTMATVRIGKFKGKISLLNMYVQGALGCEPDNPDLQLLAWNIHFYHKMRVLDFLGKECNFKAAFLGLNAQCFNRTDKNCQSIIPVADRLQNVEDINSFLDNLTAQSRESRPRLTRELPRGVSNIYITRVSLGAMGRGIVFK